MLPVDAEGNIVLSDVDYLDTWREMEKCVNLGLTRSIGLSNFNSQQIDRVLSSAVVKPVSLQVRSGASLNNRLFLLILPYISFVHEVPRLI
jgi:aldehyde reductase